MVNAVRMFHFYCYQNLEIILWTRPILISILELFTIYFRILSRVWGTRDEMKGSSSDD
jgi:hypothetical protein